MKKDIKVIKIGGSCLKKTSDLEHIANILIEDNYAYVVVVSAFKNVTNLLEKWFDNGDTDARDEIVRIHDDMISYFSDQKLEDYTMLYGELQSIHRCTREAALALGEKMSAPIIRDFLKSRHINIEMLESDPLVYVDDSGEINLETTADVINKRFYERTSQHVITQGFACWDSQNNPSNLGREGSDLTAAVWAYALKTVCALYKDVGALYNKDPKKHHDVEKIISITFGEYQNAHSGAGVIYDRVIKFYLHNKIETPLEIRSLDNVFGTQIHL